MTEETTNQGQAGYQQVLQGAKVKLDEKRKFLLECPEDERMKKAAQKSVREAEKEYLDVLQEAKLPLTLVEVWSKSDAESTDDREVHHKENANIIIGLSRGSMSPDREVNRLSKDLITDPDLEHLPLYITPAQIYYDGGVELMDLNGNRIETGTPNVYVPINSSYGYWQWKSYHEHNANRMIADAAELAIPNVRIKEFESIQGMAQYTGKNIVLSRGLNGNEKALNAAEATQDAFFKKVANKAHELDAKISTITKYYNHGKTLRAKEWNDALMGKIASDFNYDLAIGDTIIEVVKSKFDIAITRERFLIDAMTRLANYTPEGEGEKPIGIKAVIDVVSSLTDLRVTYIKAIKDNKVIEMYSSLLIAYNELAKPDPEEEQAA